MKPTLFIIPLFILTLSGCPKIESKAPTVLENIECLVTTIKDGDTVDCTTAERTKYTVRLANIDAPEKQQAFGKEAALFLAHLIGEKPITVQIYAQDKYKRYIGDISHGSMNINKAMVLNGYAWAYREYLYDSEYIQLEESAQKKQIGIWSLPNPIPPNQFRQSNNN